jgi:hypothetical protein
LIKRAGKFEIRRIVAVPHEADCAGIAR